MSAVGVRCSAEQTGLLFLTETVAFALDHQRVTVMEQAIEDRRGEDFVAKDGAPLCHKLIGRDQQTATLVSTRH